MGNITLAQINDLSKIIEFAQSQTAHIPTQAQIILEHGYNKADEWDIRLDEQDRIRKAINKKNFNSTQQWYCLNFEKPFYKVLTFSKHQWSKFWQSRRQDTAKLKEVTGG